MKIAAMVLGIIGGLAGLGGAVMALFFGGLGSAFGAHDAGLISSLGLLALPFSILGVVGGAMASAKPALAGKLMIASAIGGFISISFGYIIAAILLIIAGILAIIEGKKEVISIPNDAKENLTVEESSSTIMPWYKKKWVMILSAVLGILIVIGTVGAISGKGQDSNKKQNVDKYNFTANVQGTGKIKGIFLSDVGIAVENVSRAKTLGNQYIKKTAQGEFVIVSLAVSNHQKEKVTVDGNMFKLVDGNGRQYSHSTEGETALALSSKQDKTFTLKPINPGIGVIGSVVFDIPAGITDLKLEARGGITGEKGMLPLQVIMADNSNENQKSAATNLQQNVTNSNNQTNVEAEKKLSFMGRIKGEEVRMRPEPSTDSKIMGVFNNKEIIHVTETINAGGREWYKVTRANGSSGWVAKEFCFPVE